MSDSQNSEGERVPERQPRFEHVVRWVEYMRDNPPDVWGPQQNAVVDGQLESVQAIDRDAETEQRIRAFADRVLAEEDDE
jgi:hypothetical protein